MMYPVLTFLRHKAIVGVLGVSKLTYKLTGGLRPHFLFSAATDLTRVGSSVRVVSKDETSVTIAKYRADGSIDNGDFKIMTGTDFHMDPDDYQLNNKSIDRFVRQIRDNKPDLVILTGDIITSDCQQIDAVQFSAMMEKLGVYWCYVFGNHETREEKEYFKYLLYKGLMYYPHCLNLIGDKSLFGYGNFAVNILDGENSLRKSLFLFDSGRNIQDHVKKQLGIDENVKGYDFIKPSQIDWYVNETNKLRAKYGDGFSTITYMHIPVPEYLNVFEGDEQSGFVPSGKAELVYGTQFESIGCSPFNSGLFEKGRAECNLQAMFSGHDHINDFCAKYKGVYLVYSQCTGYNTYSMEDKFGRAEKDCHYGVTLTTLKADGSLEFEQKKNSVYLK